MDDQLLDAICKCLVSSLNTKDTYIVPEGDPVIEMLFIIRGELESSTTNGGRSGFFNSITLKQGDFCGEELLTWALVPNPNVKLPISTRIVKCLREVEAFALKLKSSSLLQTSSDASIVRNYSMHSGSTHTNGGHGELATYKLHGDAIGGKN
ncbi:putative cyclic nucleotide-gated ion channel 16 [Nicotiana attenuata]|uniref:Cyclic nucleotide-gated ion channel 16 n=1 Tax=Nicotiana attenuata TaxID=49451 RepID=A0A1J6J1R1_NICAT|nr:putative cyclic nucleotide-gated ion channel 16 [Nicotiana attenuata]